MCGRVGAGELTFESYSVGKHSAAAPAVVSAHSQLSATRLATLLHAARRWVHLLLAQVGVCCRLVASPIALVELYRTGQVWHVGGGHGSRDRYPTTRSGTNVRISQTSPAPTAVYVLRLDLTRFGSPFGRASPKWPLNPPNQSKTKDYNLKNVTM